MPKYLNYFEFIAQRCQFKFNFRTVSLFEFSLDQFRCLQFLSYYLLAKDVNDVHGSFRAFMLCFRIIHFSYTPNSAPGISARAARRSEYAGFTFTPREVPTVIRTIL